MRKRTKTFHFSTEGETEIHYLKHLGKLINNDHEANCRVSIHAKKKKPLSYVKSLSVIERVEITHLHDYESPSQEHQDVFRGMFSDMKTARDTMRNRVKAYVSGYSNLSFDLWIVLHKATSNRAQNHRRDYLREIDHAFETNFASMDDYKCETNFLKVLNQISINDVRKAIERAKHIQNTRISNGDREHQHKGYVFFPKNPSLAIHPAIEKVLNAVISQTKS